MAEKEQVDVPYQFHADHEIIESARCATAGLWENTSVSFDNGGERGWEKNGFPEEEIHEEDEMLLENMLKTMVKQEAFESPESSLSPEPSQ
jgi:hypothetical protein